MSPDFLLFRPISIGGITLKHRVVLPALGRVRNNAAYEPLPELAVTYYAQRASISGTLLIAEGTFISLGAAGMRGPPGIWSERQIAVWKQITDAVYAKGSYIYLQLCAMGSSADPKILKEDGDYPLIGPSHAMVDGYVEGQKNQVRAMTVDEIKAYTRLYAIAAENAIQRAGFDGAEIHGANGLQLDQFLQSITNTRTDEYGGSIENRVRFPLEVLDAVVKAVGQSKVGFRVSPWSHFRNMRMPDEDLVATYTTLVTRIRDTHSNLSYLHVIQPRSSGDGDESVLEGSLDSDEFLRKVWGARPYIAAGGFTRESAMAWANETGGLVAFGRHFLANPDLPIRLRDNIPLNPYNRATFYTPGPVGYIDYPFA